MQFPPRRRPGPVGLSLLAIGVLLGHCPLGAATANVQEYFVPVPEGDLQTSLRAIDTTGTPVGNTIRSTLSVVVGTTGTIIRYDHWEDGYENDLSNPIQGTTRVWGDGNDANGMPPGVTHDPAGLAAGTVITLQNDVMLPRNPAVIQYDGRDRIGATSPIVVTRAGWGTSPGTVLCSAMEVYDTSRYGTAFTVPVGKDVVTTAGAQLFSYSALHILAAQDNTGVQVDRNADGTVDLTQTLQRGESLLINGGVTRGATVTASLPVLVEEVTGRVGSTYMQRTFALRPTSQWDASYFAPVGTTLSSEPNNVFLYNPTAAALSVQYAARAGAGSVTVPAKGTYQFTMPINSGAHFYTADGTKFYAVGASDSGSGNTANQTHDWGYALLPESALTTHAVIGWAPGSDGTPPSQNGSPVWVTPSQPTTLYVNYSGNYLTGPYTAPNGYKYDVAYTLGAFQSQTIYDATDKNMTGARLFTTDGATFTAAWGEDPAKAGAASPYLDLGTTILPFPAPVIHKGSGIFIDVTPQGQVNAGDTLKYTIRVANGGMSALYNTVVLDNLPSGLTYVNQTTATNGVAVLDDPVPALTPFPLDNPGFLLPYIAVGGYVDITFEATVNAGEQSIVNVASATASGSSISTSVTIPVGGPTACSLTFTDPLGNVVTSYAENGAIYVSVADSDRNTNPNVAETFSVVVRNTTTGDLETVTLTETGMNTGVFRNSSAPLAASATGGLNQQDGILNARAGDSLQAEYSDTLYPESCTANASVAYAGKTKKLYLSDPSQSMDRVDPADPANPDATLAQTVLLGPGVGTDQTLVAFETGTEEIAIKNSASAVGQTFRYSVGSGSYTVTKVAVKLRNAGSDGSTITLSLRSAWGGTDLASASVSATTIASTANWVVFTLSSPVSLTVNTTYYIRMYSSNNNGKTVWITNGNGGYADGSAIESSGVILTTDRDFRIIATTGGGGTTAASFLQSPAFCQGFTVAAGTLSATTYISSVTGTPTGNNITATLGYDTTTIAAMSNPTYNSGVGTLTWTYLVPAPISVPADKALNFVIGNTQSGVSFKVDYDLSTKPSAISLPTSTVINVDSLSVYDDAYPGGSLITSSLNGQTGYIRATVSDPFGASDITSLEVTITGPGGTSAVTLNAVVTSSDCSKTFEFPWLAGPLDGDYSITVTAREGTEGTVTASASTGFQVNSLDLGTPGTTTFIDGSGNPTQLYLVGNSVCVQVVDPDQNTDANRAETVTAVITTGNGDRESVLLTETGLSTGVFRGCLGSDSSPVTQNNDTLNLVAGAGLNVTYTDPTDATDVSGDTALVPVADPNPVVTVNKTLVNPTSGPALVGGTVEYDLLIANPGTVNLPVVSVTDTFPAENLTFDGASLAPTGTTPAGTLTWSNVGSLASGQSVTLHLSFTATAAGSPVNSVAVSGSASASASAAAVTIVDPKVSVSKTLLSPASGPAYINDLVTFRITIQNMGTTRIDTLPLQDQYSGSCFQLVSATVTPDSQGGGLMLWNNLGPLGAGATTTVDVTLKAVGNCDPANNSATVSGAEDANGYALPTTQSSAQIQLLGASLSGQVWNDADGSQTDNAGDAPLPGANVYLDLNGDGVRNPTEPFALTDANGQYMIDGLPPGTYTVRVDPATLGGVTTATIDPDGIATPNVATVSLAEGENKTGVDYGYWSGLVQGTLFTDTNGNGTYDPFVDTPLANVQVKITASDGTIYTVTTGPTGYYSQVVPPGAAVVDVVDSTLPSGAVLATGNIDPQTVTVPGSGSATANTGYTFPAQIGTVNGIVFLDNNGNGTYEAGTDAPLPGVQVLITKNGGGTLTVTTDSTGAFSATVPIGSTSVDVLDATLPGGATLAPGGGNSDSTTVTVPLNGTAIDNTGYELPANQGLVNGIVYLDANGDGVYTAGTDQTIAGVPVLITKSDNSQVTVTTDANGYFQAVVPAGNTVVDVQQGNGNFPAGYVLTADASNQGSDPTTVDVPSQKAVSDNTGYVAGGNVSGTVFDDVNGLTDGLVNGTGTSAGEPLYANLVDAGGIVAAVCPVAGDGTYGFSGVTGGSYTVLLSRTPGTIGQTASAAALPANWVNTGEGTAAAGDGTANGITAITVTSVTTTGVNFGITRALSVGNLVWADVNDDGLVQADEPGLPDVVVQLCDPAGSLMAQTTTDADGFYLFTEQRPSNYLIRIPASNFQAGGALEHHPAVSSVAVTADNQTDDDNNGSQPGGAGTEVSSPLIALGGNAEPVDAGTETGRGQALDNGYDAGADLTVDFGFAPGSWTPTAVRLEHFRARRVGPNQILLAWRSLAEIQTLGYYAERQGRMGWERVSPQLIAALGQDLQPHAYTLSDPVVSASYYRLVEVDWRGNAQVLAYATVTSGGQMQVNLDGDSLKLQVQGAPDGKITVESAPDVVNGPWSSAATGSLDGMGVGAFTLPVLKHEPMQFLRLRED